MLTNVTIILSEEIWGPHATHRLEVVLLSNAAWLIIPLLPSTGCGRTRSLSRAPPARRRGPGRSDRKDAGPLRGDVRALGGGGRRL
jgi:hypothetical protein